MGFERIIKTAVTWNGAGLTLEYFLAGRFTYRSAEEWRERIAQGEITLNGEPVAPDRILALHDVVEYHPGDIVEPESDLDYHILFEDQFILVIDKPGNLCVHPSGPYFHNTLWYLLKEKFGEIHLVNRLDRETSGILIGTKLPQTAAMLSRNRDAICKKYQVIVHGVFPDELDAKGFLFSDLQSQVQKKRAFAAGDRPPQGAVKVESSHTLFRTLKRGNGLSLVEAILDTGRMHQIRATCFSLGFPVVGDKLYGLDETMFLKIRSDSLTAEDRAKLRIPCQALHSCEVEFTHPATHEKLHFTAPAPESWKSLL